MVTHRAAVDETNPEVQQLLDAKMGSPERCIRAVKMYGTAHLAMNYMMKEEAEKNEFPLLESARSPTLPMLQGPIQQVRRYCVAMLSF